MTHGDPKNPKKNLHPVKRYEVIATADAPGPWDSVTGYLSLQVTNVECVPKDSFTGGQNVPNTGYEFDMTRVDDKPWKGYFYRDVLQDEDYFGLGICHWGVISVKPEFSIHGELFAPDSMLEKSLSAGLQKYYFKKIQYEDKTLKNSASLQFLANDPPVTQSPDSFFPITVLVKDSTP